MQDSKQLELSLKTLAATIFLGVAGDLLLRDVPWGVGFAAYAFVILAVGTYIYRNRSQEFGKGVLWVVPPALLFASLFAWRDSNDLKVLNGVCLALIVGVLALRVRTGKIGIASLIDYPCRLLGRWIGFLGDFAQMIGLEGQAKELTTLNFGKRAMAVVRGCLIAAPLLLVFGVLFASSDAVFQHYASRAFSFDLGEVCSHFCVATACFWITGGFFRRLFLATDKSDAIARTSEVQPQLGITEISVVLSTLNALFLAFVAVQFRYLFGGHLLVQRTAHLSYSEYAHQGFFELVLAAFLGLAVLVAFHSLLKKDGARDWRAFATQSFGLIGLIFVVMASAATRLEIYVQAYGITRERIYAMSILFWLAIVLGWFCATTLRKRPERFSAGALASLFLVVFGLNVMNPDGFIAKLNTSRSLVKIDGEYLSGLSDDAVPELISALPALSGEAKAKVSASIKQKQRELSTDNWRSWDIGAENANQAISRAKL